MNVAVLIGIGAGFAAAVMYASAAGGSVPMMVLLNLLTPQPLMLAGLGWGALSGLVAAVAGTLVLAAIAPPKLAVVFGLVYALPSALIAFLCLLHRPSPAPASPASTPPATAPLPKADSWFPIGRILAIAASLACLFSLAGVHLLGPNTEARRAAIRAFLDKGFFEQLEAVTGHKLAAGETDQLVAMFDYVVPASTAISWLTVILFNTWLAGRITLASGTLLRPWPDLAELRLPLLFPFIFAGLVGLLFARDPAPLMAAGPLGAFLMVYMLVGLAVLHSITRRLRLRPLLLSFTYAGMVVLPQIFAVLAVAIGLGEPILRLRQRLNRPLVPPAAPPGAPT